MEAIIDLTRKDWEYHSLLFGFLTPNNMPSFLPTDAPIDVMVLFYKKDKKRELIGRLLYPTGNKMKFEKHNLDDDKFGSLDFFKDYFEVTKVEKYLADNGDGNSLAEKLCNRKNSDLDLDIKILKNEKD